MTVYVMAHKKFTMPDEGCDRAFKTDYLVPLQVGAKGKQSLGYERDDEGDNISEKNQNFCELTGIYQVWKNRKTDIVGICHYRRYFCNEKGQLLTESDIRELLNESDVLVSEYTTSIFTMREEYERTHKKKDLDILEKVVEEISPDYLEAFNQVFSGNGMYVGNLMICRWEIFDAYCRFLFQILFEVEKRVDLSDYNGYQKRIFGFMSERLLTVWLKKHSELTVREMKIGITGDKAEKTELFNKLQNFLDEKKDEEALKLYLDATGNRPDLINDANGTKGVEMDVLMLGNVLKIADRERRELENWQEVYILNYSRKIPQLIKHYTNLYSLLHQLGDANVQGLFIQYVRQFKVSAAAVCVVIRYADFSENEKKQLLNLLFALFSGCGMQKRAEYVKGWE